MPLLFDIAAHTFFEHQHLLSEHQAPGHHHLDHEIARAANDNATDNKSVVVKLYDETPSTLPVQYMYRAHLPSAAVNYNRYHHFLLPVVFLTIQLPPPKVRELV